MALDDDTAGATVTSSCSKGEYREDLQPKIRGNFMRNYARSEMVS